MRSHQVFLALVGAAAFAFLLFVIRPDSTPDARAVESLDEARSQPAESTAEPIVAAPSVTRSDDVAPIDAPPVVVAPASRPTTIVAPGTPAQFLRPYLDGYTPSEIRVDGTQVYRDLPVAHVRQPDGSFVTQLATVEVKPGDVTPALPETPDASDS